MRTFQGNVTRNWLYLEYAALGDMFDLGDPTVHVDVIAEPFLWLVMRNLVHACERLESLHLVQ